METMELKLNSPITKEQWELLTDENLEHSDTMWFDTPNGNHFEYKKVRNGKWIERKVSSTNADIEFQSARCSVCNRYHTTPYLYSFYLDNFCPNCGARMEQSEE